MLVHPQQLPVRRNHSPPLVELCRYIRSSLIGSRCSANVFMHTSQLVFAWNLPHLTIITSNYTSQGSQRSNVWFTYMRFYQSTYCSCVSKKVKELMQRRSNKVAKAPFRLFRVDLDPPADLILTDSHMSRRSFGPRKRRKGAFLIRVVLIFSMTPVSAICHQLSTQL